MNNKFEDKLEFTHPNLTEELKEESKTETPKEVIKNSDLVKIIFTTSKENRQNFKMLCLKRGITITELLNKLIEEELKKDSI